MQSFVCEESYLEVDASGDWQPVEGSKGRCYVLVSWDVTDNPRSAVQQSGCSLCSSFFGSPYRKPLPYSIRENTTEWMSCSHSF